MFQKLRDYFQRRPRYTTRDLVLVSVFAGVFLAYGYTSGVSLPQQITHSLDLFFLIATLFTILALEIRQSWSATLLGTITGVIFLGTPGAPAPWHITLALIGNGLVFDGYLRLMSRKTIPPSKWHMVGAASLGNLVMAIVGLSALQATTVQTSTQPLPLLPWVGLVIVTGFLGAAGAMFGIAVVRRLRVSTGNKGRMISMETSTLQPGQIRQ